MRFHRQPRHEFEDTPRKRAAVLVSQRKARQRLPLFGELIAETQAPVDVVMEERALSHAAQGQRNRDHRAGKWREARRRLAGYGDNIRPVLLAYWNEHRWLPGDPVYLLDMLHMYDTERLQAFDTFKARTGESVETPKWAEMVGGPMR